MKFDFGIVGAVVLILLLSIPLGTCVSHAAGTYNVSPKGADSASRNGSPVQPWRTLAYACSRLSKSADKGLTIVLDEGTFVESTPSILPSGTNIRGAGAGKTIIRSTISHELSSVTGIGDIAEEDFTILLRDVRNSELSGFTLDGGSRAAHAGIFVNRSSNVKIHDLIVKDFNYTGIWMTYTKKSEVASCTVSNSSFEATAECNNSSGCIMVGDINDCCIHDLTVREDRKSNGIKGWRYEWTRWDAWALPPDAAADYMIVDCRFYNLDIHVNPVGAWNNGQAPNITFEFCGADIRNSELYNSKFNTTVSIVGGAGRDLAKTFRIHHNTFPMGNVYVYGIEADYHHLEVDHNYFQGGYEGLANWGPPKDHISVHHNIFYDIKRMAAFYASYGARYLTFTNNTMYNTSSRIAPVEVYAGKANGGILENVVIKDNIFYKTGNRETIKVLRILDKTLEPANITIDNNLFYNWAEDGTNPLVGDPLFVGEGGMPDPFFGLKDGSPASAKELGALRNMGGHSETFVVGPVVNNPEK